MLMWEWWWICAKFSFFSLIYQRGNGKLMVLGNKHAIIAWNLRVCLLAQNVNVFSVRQDLGTNLCLPGWGMGCVQRLELW